MLLMHVCMSSCLYHHKPQLKLGDRGIDASKSDETVPAWRSHQMDSLWWGKAEFAGSAVEPRLASGGLAVRGLCKGSLPIATSRFNFMAPSITGLYKIKMIFDCQATLLVPCRLAKWFRFRSKMF